MEEGSFPVWKGDAIRMAVPGLVSHMYSTAGLFDWSMKFQDGTKPTGTVNPEDFTPERRAWLADALKYYMQDFAVRANGAMHGVLHPSWQHAACAAWTPGVKVFGSPGRTE